MPLSNKSGVTSRKKPHVVFLYYYFPPMGGGGVQRIVKWLKYWDYRRFEVSVLTVKESYFYAADPSLVAEVPTDKIRIVRTGSLDIFRLIGTLNKLIRRSTVGSATPPIESHDGLRRLSSWLFIPDSRVGWLPPALLGLWHLHREHPIDVVVASMPPFTTGVIGALFSRWQQVPLVVDYRDAWLENPYIPVRPGIVNHIHRQLERFVLRQAQGAIFVNPALIAQVFQGYKHLALKSVVVRNGYDPVDFQDLPSPATPPPIRIGIVGSVYSQGNRPLALMAALQKVLTRFPQWQKTIRIHFIGKWSPGFLKQMRTFPFPDIIQWEPYLPHRQALQAAAQCHILSLTIENQWPGGNAVTPGRLYEYLALRRSILAIVPPESDAAQVVRQNKAGTIIAPDDIDAIEHYLQTILQNPAAISPVTGDLPPEFERQTQAQQLMAYLQQFL